MDKPPVEIKAELTVDGTSAVQGATRFMGQLLGPAATEFGGMLKDQVKFWRVLRMMDFIEKFDAKVDARGIDPKRLEAIRPGLAIPIIEAASYEEFDEVQDLWAELLVNAQDPDRETVIEKAFISLLKEFGPCETAMFQLSAKYNSLVGKTGLSIEFIEETAAEYEHALEPFSDEQRRAAVMNLRRLGLARVNIDTSRRFEVLQPMRLTNDLGRPMTSINPREFDRMMKWLAEQIEVAGGAVSGDLADGAGFQIGGKLIRCPELGLLLTPLGQRLAGAVSITPVRPRFETKPGPGGPVFKPFGA